VNSFAFANFLNLSMYFFFLTIGEKPFECSNCHERFARNSTLKCHLTACQTGVGAKKGRKKLYECQVCVGRLSSHEERNYSQKCRVNKMGLTEKFLTRH
jgi:hypothetical protein